MTLNGNGNGFIITKETWEHMSQEQRDWVLFDTMKNLTNDVKSLKRWNKCTSFLGGIVGGVAAVLGIKLGG